jgi:hypothetical protein
MCILLVASAATADEKVAKRSRKSNKEADASLTKARDYIDQRKYDDAVKYINANTKLISEVDGDHAPKMLNTIGSFRSIEKLIATSKWSDAEKILNAIAEKKCCKLKYDIYPNAIKYYQALIKNKNTNVKTAMK